MKGAGGRTTVPLLATLAPAVRTLAKTTLPKLPSPISLRTSNLSSKAIALEPTADPLWVRSCATVMMRCVGGGIQSQGLEDIVDDTSGMGSGEALSGRAYCLERSIQTLLDIVINKAARGVVKWTR